MRETFSISPEVVELSKLMGQDALWTTGLMNSPHSWLQAPTIQEQIIWHKVGEEGACFSYPAFGDGSGLFPRCSASRRCGSAVVACKFSHAFGVLEHSTEFIKYVPIESLSHLEYIIM